MQYVYDAAGNITRITDGSNSNQQQNFGYDALDRLVSAATNGVGNGQYSEVYAYNAIGNITSKSGVGSYGYGDAAHKHAVTHLDGVQRYWYDANGNMTTRIEDDIIYQQAFDIENRLTIVTQTTTSLVAVQEAEAGVLNGLFAVGADSAANGGQYIHVPDGAGNRNAPDEAHKASFYFNITTAGTYVIKGWVRGIDGNGDSFWVKVDGNPAQGHLWDTPIRPGYVSQHVNDRNGAPVVMVALSVGQHRVDVYLREDGTRLDKIALERVVSSSQTTFVYDGDGRRVKKVDAGGTTFYPGEHYEVKGGVVTKYYYLGGQRVAMKVGSTVYWLHGDHLGSASLTTNSSGGIYAQQRYYPYGEVRWSSGSLPTDLQYTGQRNETALGIYDYKARFYSPRLGRFLSADTLVPGVGSQHLSRYMYVTGNPIRYNDPTGHARPVDEDRVDVWTPAQRVENAKKLFLVGMGMPVAGYAWGKYNAFGDNRGTDKDVKCHPAIDASGEEGTDIYATYPGRVVQVTDGTDDEMKKIDFGRQVVIEHTVMGVKLYSVYVHLASVSVQVGDEVNKSTVIGGMGNSGLPPADKNGERKEMVVHLHYEVRTSLYVEQDKKGNISLSVTKESYWANSYEELNRGWVDLGPVFGYYSNYPTTWTKRPPIKR